MGTCEPGGEGPFYSAHPPSRWRGWAGPQQRRQVPPSLPPGSTVAGSTLMMVGRFVVVGKMERPMDMEYALDPRARANTPAHGTMGSRCPAFTRGPVEVFMKATGKTVNAMDWGLNLEGDGYIGESGPRASRGGTGSDSPPQRPQSMRELGPMDSKMAMALKLMRMEEPIKANGCGV